MSGHRLSPLDCAFLHVEDRSNRMQLAGLLCFDGQAPSFAEMREAIEARLPQLPRFRQRLAPSAFGLRAPRWVEDDEFNLDYHLHHLVLPAPGGEREVSAHVDHLTAVPLDLQRPLWEISLVDGLAGGWALSLKVHHVMVDGLSIMDVFATLFSPDPADGPLPAPGKNLAAAAAPGGPAASAPIAPLGSVVRTGRLVHQAGAALMNRGASGPTRRTHALVVPMSAIHEIRRPYAATVNHVVLAVVAGALRRYLERHGDAPVPMFAFVPVNRRPDSARGSLGNQIAMTYPELPVGIGNPVDRLRAVMDAVAATSRSSQADDTEALLQLGRFLPQPLAAVLNRRMQFDAGLFNLTVTNVPGPPVPVYFLGRRLRQIVGSTPLTRRHGLTVAAISYDGELTISLTTDPARVPDVEGLASDFVAEVDALLGSVREGGA